MFFVEKTLSVLPNTFTKEDFGRKYYRIVGRHIYEEHILEAFQRFNIKPCGYASEKMSCGSKTVIRYSKL